MQDGAADAAQHAQDTSLDALTHDEAIDTVILETGDGMAISVKKEDEN